MPLALVALLVAGVVTAVAAVGALHTAGGQTPTSPFESTDRTIPSSIAHLPLQAGDGSTTDLAAYRGKVVILADFMTSCQEECPITTGALLQVHQALAADHLLQTVVMVEISVDATRDTPTRLAAYAAKFQIPWMTLSATAATLHSLWSWFGVWYQRVAEGTPPNINWETGQPYTYDITHSDDVFLVDASGVVRSLVTGEANTGGKLPTDLRSLLDTTGRKQLARPAFGNWSPTQLLTALGAVLGRPVRGG